jgi:hypothetical protein
LTRAQSTIDRKPVPGNGRFVPIKPSWLVRVMMIIILYFLSYRYPFMINSASTSQLYADTPAWLQMTKYILLLPLISVALIATRIRSADIGVIEIAAAILMAYSLLVAALIFPQDGEIGRRLFNFSFSFLFIIYFSKPNVTGQNFDFFIKQMKLFFYISIPVYLFQIGNFLIVNRLPALGYYGTFPRFGGIWDDPNGVGGIFVFMAAYCLGKTGINTRNVGIMAICALAILLTQSLTTFGGVLVVFVVAVLLFHDRIPLQTRILNLGLLALATIIVALVASFVLLRYYNLSIADVLESMNDLIETKSRSAAVRADSYSFVNRISVGTVFGLNPVLGAGENGYLNLLANIGLPYLLGYLALQLATLYQLWRWALVASRDAVRPAVIGMFCYMLWFVLGQVNIPLGEVYPVNIVAAIMTGMTWAWHGARSMRVARGPGVGSHSGMVRA